MLADTGRRILDRYGRFWHIAAIIASFLIAFGSFRAAFANVVRLQAVTEKALKDLDTADNFQNSRLTVNERDIAALWRAAAARDTRDAAFQSEVRADIKELLRRSR